MEPQSQQENIDLAQLIRSLWSNRKLLVGCTALGLMLAIVGLQLVKPSVEGRYPLKPVSEYELQGLYELKHYSSDPVTRGALFKLLRIELKKREVFLQALTKYFPAEDVEELELLASDFSLIEEEQIRPDEKVIREFFIVHPDMDAGLFMTVVETAITLASDQVRKQVMNHQYALLAEQSRSRSHQLEDVNLQIAAADTTYQFGIQKRIAFLKEQEQIARSVGLAGDHSVMPTQAENAPMISIDKKKGNPFFMRGYRGISAEIAELESRDTDGLYSSKIADLMTKRDAITQDLSLERLKGALDGAFLSGQAFPVLIEKSNYASFNQSFSQKAVLFLSVLLGFSTGLLVAGIKRLKVLEVERSEHLKGQPDVPPDWDEIAVSPARHKAGKPLSAIEQPA